MTGPAKPAHKLTAAEIETATRDAMRAKLARKLHRQYPAESRADAERALDRALTCLGTGDYFRGGNPAETDLADVLADLLLWAAVGDVDFEYALDEARHARMVEDADWGKL